MSITEVSIPQILNFIVYRTKIKIDDINFIVVVQAYCYSILDAITYVQQKLLKNSEGVASVGSIMVTTHQNNQ